jgi:hypothetical protein
MFSPPAKSKEQLFSPCKAWTSPRGGFKKAINYLKDYRILLQGRNRAKKEENLRLINIETIW